MILAPPRSRARGQHSLFGTQGLLGSDQLRRYRGRSSLCYAGGQRVLRWSEQRSRQIVPSSTARLIHGITSSSISLSEVDASNPSTRAAFSVAGIRHATSCSKGGSAT
jgi:hypothetical protein